MKRLRTSFLVAALCLSLTACETVTQVGGKALEVVGIKKPELPQIPQPPEIPESAKPARRMKLTLAASESLNVDPAGKSLSLVARVYKLRSATAFLNAPYETFGNAAKEKEVLGDELLEAREIVLLPGQQQKIDERWVREAAFVGVVGLFRVPATRRWRYAFELETFQLDPGFVLGAHACSLSIGSGQPVGISASEMKLSPPVCPKG
jgi:type VI secretion system protein VasD